MRAFLVILPSLSYPVASGLKSSYNQKKLTVNNSNTLFQAIIDEIVKDGSITRYQKQSILGVGQSRGLKVSKEIVDAKIIVSSGRGKNTEYLLCELQ
ncbi:MAG: hypothetical protein K0R09_2645 [Clostridiales bacterium]|nr:hypothetical protein [Clostridiales bacterium]